MRKVKNFNVRMWQIFYDRFDNNITLQKLAEKHGVTRERIRQIEAKAIRLYRNGNYLTREQVAEELSKIDSLLDSVQF